MHLTRLLRHRLVLLIAAEVLIVAAFCIAAWHVWMGRAPGGSPGAGPPPAAAAPDAVPGRPPQISPGVPHPSPPAARQAGPTPGIRTDADFLARQLRDINRDQSALAVLEWRAARGIIEAMRGYLERVVLPAVEGAQQGAR